MNNLIYSLNGTIPIFAVMVIGYILKRQSILTPEFVTSANRYVFRVALPVMVFKDLWEADIRKGFDWKFVVFCFAASSFF